MSYTVAARIFQTNPCRPYFRIVEQANFTGGTWSRENESRVLCMTSSGTCGAIRFESDNGEFVTVVLGVHNYRCWCDVVTGLSTSETAATIVGQYYGGVRDAMREKQLAQYSVTSAAGTKVEVKYTVADGNNLKADIIFG